MTPARRAELEPTPEGPHGWIQWKGTNVCMDIHCGCDKVEHAHVDLDFFYFYECPGCHKKYKVGQYVSLIELDAEAQKDVTCFKTATDWDGPL